MEYKKIRAELKAFKDAGINVTIGQFAKFINAKSEEVVVKKYQYKILSGTATKHNLKAIA